MPVLPRHGVEFIKTLGQAGAAGGVGFGSVFAFAPGKADGICEQATQLLGESGPVLARRLISLDVFEIAQQVYQTLLRMGARHGIVRAPEVGHQRALEFLYEKSQQRGLAARLVDQKIAQVVAGEAPEPVGLSVDTPAGFVGVEHRGIQRFALDVLVPRLEYLRQALPHVKQAARRDLEQRWKLNTSTIWESVLPRQ